MFPCRSHRGRRPSSLRTLGRQRRSQRGWQKGGRGGWEGGTWSSWCPSLDWRRMSACFKYLVMTHTVKKWKVKWKRCYSLLPQIVFHIHTKDIVQTGIYEPITGWQSSSPIRPSYNFRSCFNCFTNPSLGLMEGLLAWTSWKASSYERSWWDIR